MEKGGNLNKSSKQQKSSEAQAGKGGKNQKKQKDGIPNNEKGGHQKYAPK